MVIDFEHHYIPIELARRMGINTETKTIVEEDGAAKANVHVQLFDLDAQIRDMDRTGIRLIAGGVLERYPELEFVISHFGGGMAGCKERIARSSYRFKLPKPFADYFDRLYFDMAGFEGSPIALSCAMEGIKPERMVFATDYPQNFNNSDPKIGKNVEGIRAYIQEIQSLPLDAGIKDDMLGGTAARLLKMSM
jgi:predicted TIM-barrel fold metal-dependent hydrolase